MDGVEQGALAARINLASAGVWWLAFGVLSIRRLRERGAQRALPKGDTYLSIGFKQLGKTLREIRRYPMTLRYLIAYLLYNDGIQTVIVVSAIFGQQELGMNVGDLSLLILMVQVVGIFGALGFGRVADRLGAKRTIVITLIVWSAVAIWSRLSLASVGEFWILGVVIALVLGGSQALSRSLFSQMIPRERESEFFSFYEISERGTSWIGPFLFARINDVTKSMRTAIFSLIVLFVGGLVILLWVNVPRAIREAGNAVPETLEPEPTPA
jgi:UMF1 family MFS transporter